MDELAERGGPRPRPRRGAATAPISVRVRAGEQRAEQDRHRGALVEHARAHMSDVIHDPAEIRSARHSRLPERVSDQLPLTRHPVDIAIRSTSGK
jgi:hypothetical protein